MRGAGFHKCPSMQLSGAVPTVAAGNSARIEGGIVAVPPGPPHCTIPLNGLPAPGISAPEKPVTLPSTSIAGALAGSNFAGSKLKAMWSFSRYVPYRLRRNPKFKVRVGVTRQSS